MIDCLQYPNQLVLRVALQTGLRVSDILNFRTCKLKQIMYVKELKTGKTKRIYLPIELLHKLQGIAGKVYVFEGRNSIEKHRTRQAVYKDLKRVSRLYGIPKNLQISPHSLRKIYAVEKFKNHNLKYVQKLLNHSDPLITSIYAYSDFISARKLGK